MKFANFGLALLALPALFANAMALPEAQPETASELDDRTFTCSSTTRASCYIMGYGMTSSCLCDVMSYTAKPSQPCGSGTYASCTSISSLVKCWDQGYAVDNNCNCVVPATSTSVKTTSTSSTKVSTTSAAQTTAAGTCNDWLAISICLLEGKTTDGKCNCVSGTATVPGGSSSCSDATAMSNCFKQGYGCNAKCVCTPVTTTSTSAKTTSTTSTTSVKTTSTTTPCTTSTTSVKTTSSSVKTISTSTPCTTSTTSAKTTSTSVKTTSTTTPCTTSTTSVKTTSTSIKTTSTSVKATSTSSSAAATSTAAGTCKDWLSIAVCAIEGKTTNGQCQCVSGTPTVPGGSSSCGDATAMSNCFKQGYGCNAKCVCTPATTSSTVASSTKASSTTSPPAATTTPSGVCKDWLAISICLLEGKTTNGQCQCVSGTPTVPGGSSSCTDSTAMSNCFKQGYGCNAKCVCTPVSTTSSTATTTSQSSTPTAVGSCKNAAAISACALRGLGVNSDCSCNKCNCDAQWSCVKKGGILDSSCNCILPSGSRRRRDATYVNHLCAKGMTACRLDSSESGWNGQFECLDVTTQLESCGGCVGEGHGQDCSAIDGVADVACIASRCVVSACQTGWTLVNGTTCEPSNAARFQQVLGSLWEL